MVAILWDDSDGWYDHALAPLTTQSQTGLDTLTNPGQCGANTSRVPSGQQARRGLGPRLPLLIVSPFAWQNFADFARSSPRRGPSWEIPFGTGPLWGQAR
jgi:phospholipase C